MRGLAFALIQRRPESLQHIVHQSITLAQNGLQTGLQCGGFCGALVCDAQAPKRELFHCLRILSDRTLHDQSADIFLPPAQT